MLLVIFPFDFQYLVDPLSDALKFTLQWVSDDIAHVVMELGVIELLFATVYSPFAYKFLDLKHLRDDRAVTPETG